jgi:hypothetical protein
MHHHLYGHIVPLRRTLKTQPQANIRVGNHEMRLAHVKLSSCAPWPHLNDVGNNGAAVGSMRRTCGSWQVSAVRQGHTELASSRSAMLRDGRLIRFGRQSPVNMQHSFSEWKHFARYKKNCEFVEGHQPNVNFQRIRCKKSSET